MFYLNSSPRQNNASWFMSKNLSLLPSNEPACNRLYPIPFLAPATFFSSFLSPFEQCEVKRTSLPLQSSVGYPDDPRTTNHGLSNICEHVLPADHSFPEPSSIVPRVLSRFLPSQKSGSSEVTGRPIFLFLLFAFIAALHPCAPGKSNSLGTTEDGPADATRNRSPL